MTATKQVICTEKIGIVSILLANGNNIELQNVELNIALAPRYDLNLILLGQL